jgi:hypothetical protein
MATINPFQGPINYSVDVQSPFEAAIGGFKIGAAGAEVQAQRQVQERAKTYQTGIDAFFSKPAAQRTYSDIEPLLVGANKQQFDALQAVAKNMSDEKLNSSKRFTGQLLVALEQNPETAKTLLNNRIEAETDPQQKLAWQDTLKVIDISPAKAANDIELLGAGAFGKEWYDGITSVRSERRTAAEAPAALRKKVADAAAAVSDAEKKAAEAQGTPARLAAEQELLVANAKKAAIDAQFAGPLAQANLNLNAAQIKQINNNISNAAAKLNLDQQTMQATVAEKLSSIQRNLNDLPEATRKLINDSAVSAAASKQSANQYNDLAKRLDEAGGGYGVATSFADYLRKQTGAQSPLTDLRQEYTRIRNSAAIKSLPQGPATDKDIELALKGIPPENADARTVAGFLRGIAKMQDIEAAVGNAKTDWLANNNGVLTRAKDTFIAGDYTTKPGETFNDFTQRVVVDKSKLYRSPAQKAEEDRAATMAKIPTTGTPAPAPVNIRAEADAILRRQ